MDSDKTYIGLNGFQARDSSAAIEQANLNQQGVLATYTSNDWYSYYRASAAFIANAAGSIYSLIQKGLITISDGISTNALSGTDIQMINNTAIGTANLRGLGRLSMTTTATGHSTDYMLDMGNGNVTAGNTTGVPSASWYKYGRNAATGDVLYTQQHFAKDSAGTKTEFARIQVKTENVTPGNQDGTLSIFTSVNGASLEVFNFNGGQNEINSFRPLDMNGNNIRTTTGSMAINIASSSTAGATLTIATKDNVAGSGAGLLLTGNTLLSATSGGNSGQHLCLTIGGSVYKIALLNP